MTASVTLIPAFGVEWTVPSCALCNLFPFPFGSLCLCHYTVNFLTLSDSQYLGQSLAHKANVINACLNRKLTHSVIWKILTS